MFKKGLIKCILLAVSGMILFTSCGKKAEDDEALYNSEGKKIVKLFASTEMCQYFITNEMIESFNEENPDYAVEICKNTGTLDSVFIMNEHPDIMFEMDLNQIDGYIDNGYLADLTPYFKKSSDLGMGDLYEGVVDCFTKEGNLYAIPQFAAVKTLRSRNPGVNESSGWTVEEFLDWLQSDKATYHLITFDRGQLLQ